jgi:hypothetical protein
MRHKESGGKEEASLADRRADDEAKARVLSCVCSGPEVGKGWPHRVDAGLLLEQGACEMRGEIKSRAGRVSTGRVGPRIGEEVY